MDHDHDMSEMENMEGMEMPMEAPMPSKLTLKAQLDAAAPLKLNVSQEFTLTLRKTDSNELIEEKDLQVVHTRPLHLLVVDSTLVDYQHLHPIFAGAGQWKFTFAPHLPGAYRVWVDVTPVDGPHQYIPLQIGEPGVEKAQINTTPSNEVIVSGYKFILTFEEPPAAGQATMGTIDVTDEAGQPVKKLEPVMGAFGHIVGFGSGGASVVHVHPLGDEPKNDSERSGPQLSFHMNPEGSGFMKLFAQVKIDGKEIFAPFGVQVGTGR